MLGNRKMVFIFALLTSVAVAGLVSAVDIPKKQHDIVIDHLKGKKGKVKFSHLKHSVEYKVKGKLIACKKCHHTLKKEPKTKADVKKIKACTECHVQEGQPLKKHGGKDAAVLGIMKDAKKKKYDKKKVLYHGACQKCHKKVAKKNKKDDKLKKLGKCKACHSKKK